MRESELDNLGMKWVQGSFHVRGDATVVTCAGCGFPVNQDNPRCHVSSPEDYMGTYGPCCAPTPSRRVKWWLLGRTDHTLRWISGLPTR